MQMIDAQCSRCRRRLGWAGRMADRPACPRCGHRPPQAELDAADRLAEEMDRLFAALPSAGLCRQQRVAAGLTLRQAARLLFVSAAVLSDYESGRQPLPDSVAAQMGEVYGCGEPS